jgi:hypothetical protein
MAQMHRRKRLTEQYLSHGFIYALGTIILFALDNVVDKVKTGSEVSFNSIYTTVFSATSLYPWTSGWFRKPQTQNVAIVTITIGQDDDAAGESLSDNCARRKFLADLITAIDNAKPRGLVLDYMFGKGQCVEGDTERSDTSKLERSLQESATANGAVIIGQGAYRKEDLESNWPSEFIALRSRGFKDADLFIKPLPAAVALLDSRVHPGLVQLNADYRKIPLSWRVFSNDGAAPYAMDTISVAAVRAFSGNGDLLNKLNMLQREGRHPFTSFAKEQNFLIVPAATIMARLADSSDLKNRIVLVSIIDPEHNDDTHDTFMGKVPGVVLQANYVEALMDGRFLRPIDRRVQVVIGLAWFAVIEMLLKYWAGRGWSGVVVPVIIIVVCWSVISVVITWYGRYIELLFPSIFVLIAAHSADRIRDLMDIHHKKRRN